MIPANGKKEYRLRFTNTTPEDAFEDFDTIFKKRIAEADDFYDTIQKGDETKN